MPKGKKQKLKLYYLSRIMREKTDDSHSLTMSEIREYLGEYGVTADRKSIYDDLQALKVLGLDVVGESVGRNYYYHVVSKQFDLSDLKLISDAVQSSRFITEKKSKDLINKLSRLVSIYEAGSLKGQVVVPDRVRTMNDSIYHNVDELQTAMSGNNKVQFEYMHWNMNKKLVSSKDSVFEVSPWAVICNNENYYLIAYDSEDEEFGQYMVEKIRNIRQVDGKREGEGQFKSLGSVLYESRKFGTCGDDDQEVVLRFKDELVGDVLDKFGKSIGIKKSEEDGWSDTTVRVVAGDEFFGWVFTMGTGVKIISPEDVTEIFKEGIREFGRQYGESRPRSSASRAKKG